MRAYPNHDVEGVLERRSTTIGNEDDAFGGIAILHPPERMGLSKWYNLSYAFRALMLKLEDWWDPAPDQGSNMEVCHTKLEAMVPLFLCARGSEISSQ